MKDALGKRLALLSNVGILVLALASVSLLHRLDSKDLSEHVAMFHLLEQTNELDYRRIVWEERLDRRTREWLRENDSETYEQHRLLRQRITDWLLDGGAVGESGLQRLKGEEKDLPTFSLTEWRLSDAQAASLGAGGDLAETVVEKSVSHLQALRDPTVVSIAIDMPDQLPKLPSEDRPPENGWRLRVREVTLDDGEIEIPFDPGPISQIAGPRIKIKATTKQIELPSVIDLLLPEKKDALDSVVQSRNFLGAYSTINFHLAKRVAAQEFLQAHGRIEIFGISFSTRRFPVAALVVLVLVQVCVYATLNQAKRQDCRIISGRVYENTIGILLGSQIGRFLLWIVVPLAALLAVFGISRALSENVVGVAAVLLCAVGLMSVFQAKHL